MLENNALVINLNDKVSPATLATILGCNVSLLYQHSQMGRLPSILVEASYLECIQQYLSWYKKSQDVKLLKEANDKELRLAKVEEAKRLAKEKEEAKRSARSTYDGDDAIHPLVAAKMKQNIATERAREEQIYLKIAIERKDYISVEEMVELTEPFIMSIRELLLTVAQHSPELEKKVDEGMQNLYRLGLQLVEGAELDSKNFIQEMLDRELDIDA